MHANMNVGLYQSASALTALERWQDVVSQNITSSQVTAFKRRTIQFESEMMGSLASGQRASGRSDIQGCVFPKVKYGVNYKEGEVAPTGRDLDAALQGEGFFVLRQPNGQQVYSRSGEFRLSADRTLMHSTGAEVLGEGGAALQGLPTGGKIVISADGTVTQNETPIGKLQIVKFEDNSKLIPVGSGGFVAPGQEGRPVEKPEVVQGYLEGSNVSQIREMMDLVSIGRAYQITQKLIQQRDDAVGKAIEKLG